MRSVYFSFHYQKDIWRVNQVRNSGIVFGAKSVGFIDKSMWEEARTKGRRALEELILKGLNGTSVTVVLIGSETASRPWVNFEIEQSLARNNALLGVRIHHLKAPHQPSERAGAIPRGLKSVGAPIYSWNGNPHQLGAWIEDAYQAQCVKKQGLLDWFWSA